MTQPELLCGECPLSRCDEHSIWCLYRMLTKPNKAQKELLDQKRKIIKAKQDFRRYHRKQYDKRRYLENREAILATARERRRIP